MNKNSTSTACASRKYFLWEENGSYIQHSIILEMMKIDLICLIFTFSLIYVYRNAYSWIRYPGLNGSIFYDIILTASVYSSVCFLLFSSNNQLQRDEKIKIFICISCMPDNWNPNNLYCSASNSIRRVVHSGIFKLYFMIHIITEEILIWI